MDDFLSKKRESGPVLDLSKATADTQEEFRKLFDRVPDFKIKPEKVRIEEIKIKENVKKMLFKTGKKDLKKVKEAFVFSDPTPVEMRELKIGELAKVPIDWKMLTSIRPKSKVDEDFYSRLVELKKLELKTEFKDKRATALDPQIRKTKNRAGVVELRAINCTECGEDFCTGTACKQLGYDYFARVPIVPSKLVSKTLSLNIGEKETKKKKKKLKKKARTSRSPNKQRSKSKTRGKSSSPRRKSKSPRKLKSPKKSIKKRSQS